MSEDVRIKAVVQLTESKLEAFLTIVPDPHGGTLTKQFLLDALARFNVANGLDESVLERLAENPVYSQPVRVAKGTDFVVGEDAKLKFFFEKNVSSAPKMKEDGTVDFKELGLIQEVRKGDLLVLKTPRTDGTPGTDVCGHPAFPPPAKDYGIPAGRNVTLSGDKLKLFASIDGQVVYHNDRISVLNTYTVEGDVSTATGNIEFNGNVKVNGNVKSGFFIRAAGDVEVGGIVEAAEIEAGGDIVIRNGFNGGATGKLVADGCVMSKFIQSGSVVAGTKVETNYIYNSNVRSKDIISVVGKGIVIGGQICARTRVDAGTLGNESLTKTLVEVGTDPDVLKRNQELIAEIETCRNNIKALEAPVKLLSQLKEAGKLPAEKAEYLDKSLVMLERLNANLDQLSIEKAAIDEKLATFGKGYVAVRNIAYPGVTIKMGTELMPIKGKYQHTMFSRDEGYIRSGPL